MIVPVSVRIEFGEDFDKFLEAKVPLSVTVYPPGYYIYQILETVSKGAPLRIVETGCLRDTDPAACFSDGWSTYYIACWVRDHPGSFFSSVELDQENFFTCAQFLSGKNLFTDRVTLVSGDSLEFLQDKEADVYLLDSCDGFEHGLEEFKAAMEHKPKAILMDDLESKGRYAKEYAEKLNIPIQQIDRYTVFYTQKYFEG